MKRASIRASFPSFASIVLACASTDSEGDDEAFRIIDGIHVVGPTS